VIVSSNAERVDAAVKSIGSAAQGEVVDATREDEVSFSHHQHTHTHQFTKSCRLGNKATAESQAPLFWQQAPSTFTRSRLKGLRY
jgi:hypothetical protein